MLLLLTGLSLTAQAQTGKDHNFEVAKHLDIFNQLYKNLELLYVDTLNPKETIGRGITAMLRKRLQDPRVADWFSPRWNLFNECTILTMEDGEVKERRPDRVMTDGQHWVVVDFKFGSPKPEYDDQVREYMALIKTMQPEAEVNGYLWFVYSNKIEEVV